MEAKKSTNKHKTVVLRENNNNEIKLWGGGIFHALCYYVFLTGSRSKNIIWLLTISVCF